jgi:hypothetical protein
MAKHRFSQLETEGDNSLLASLPIQRDKQIFKVNISNVQSEGLCDATAGIKQEHDEQMQPLLKFALGLPRHKQPDLLLGERGEHKLWLFELGNFRMLASGTALHL